jgi:hypothetical protein
MGEYLRGVRRHETLGKKAMAMEGVDGSGGWEWEAAHIIDE